MPECAFACVYGECACECVCGLEDGTQGLVCTG